MHAAGDQHWADNGCPTLSLRTPERQGGDFDVTEFAVLNLSEVEGSIYIECPAILPIINTRRIMLPAFTQSKHATVPSIYATSRDCHFRTDCLLSVVYDSNSK